MSQAMNCRPSALLGVSDTLIALYADRATFTFAKTIENEMDAAVTRLPKNAKESTHSKTRQRVLDQFLGYDDLANQPSRFRAPSNTR